MNAEEFNAAFHKLKIKPTSQQAANLIGVSLRTVQYYSAGKIEIPTPIGYLLRLIVVTGRHPFRDKHAIR